MDRFTIYIIIRVILLVLASLLFGIIFAKPEYFFSQLIVGTIIVLQMTEMIRFARRSNKELTKFILAIKYGDVSVNFSDDKLGRDFRDLASSFREVITAFKKVKIEKESQFMLLQAIIDKISFGIIAFNEDSEVLLMNQSAIDFLKIERTKDWNYIKMHNKDFTSQVEDMVADGRKLIELGIESNNLQLSVYNHTLVLMEKYCRVITFYDIQDEIEQKEIEAWYKLIRILTHEIMNSATPLTSLTDTILMLIEKQDGQQKDPEDITEENIQDVRSSVYTIKNRTEGILKFVDAYRKLTDIPHPEFADIPLKELCNSVASLLEPDFKKRKISVVLNIQPEDLKLYCDRQLMAQVLINLLTNSMYALEDRPEAHISVLCRKNNSRINIEVKDNGKGISQEVRKKIFIPFFSTRDNGSGIGLSFSKFVILQHGGRIKVESEINKGTRFTIDLPYQKK
jgi:nitrogen fixation/metabolism regulation signal transduction histidine kinase